MIKKSFIFLFSEYISGLLAIAIVLIAFGFIPNNSAYNFKDGPSFILMKFMPLMVFLMPITFAFIKIISAYYIFLFCFIKLSKKKYNNFEINDYLIMSIIAIFTIILILIILPIREGQSLEDWAKGILKMSQWFFNPKREWSFLVYSGFVAALLSPYIFTKLLRKML